MAVFAKEIKDKVVPRRQLSLQTTDLIAAFMIWVILSTLLPYIRLDISLTQDQAAWVVAVPVILGSALRIPFGYLAGKYGARIIFVISFVFLLFPILLISQAADFWSLIIGGTALGVAGAVFSVGVTSLTRYYPKKRQGFVNGVYGLGNIGTALSAFVAPAIAMQFGWRLAVLSYLGLALVIVLLNLLLGDRYEEKLATPVVVQVKSVCFDYRSWLLSFFYFITFGAFVAFTIIMPNFLSQNYVFDGQSAGFITGIFIVLAACLRIAGGWLADRFNSYRLLSFVFGVMAVGAILLVFTTSLVPFLAGVFIVGICCGLGNGIVFKLVPEAFPAQVGIASGFVAMMGGFGGFFPPLMLSFFFGLTGSYAAGFFAFTICIVICLVLSLAAKRKVKHIGA